MTVRLATYNLLHGMPVLGGVPQPQRDSTGAVVGPPVVDGDGPLREAVSRLDADVIGLQEVDVAQPRSGRAHQVRAVAEALDAPFWVFAPSVLGTPGEPGWSPATSALDHAVDPVHARHDSSGAPAAAGGAADPGGDDAGADLRAAMLPGADGPRLYGVGLVSRRPVLEWRTTRFDPAPFGLPLLVPAQPRPRFVHVPDEPRAAIAAVVSGERGPFTVATAHLSFVPGYNVRQLRRLRAWLDDLPRPVVLLGDFNLPGVIPARVTGWTPLLRAATYPSMRTRAQLDHVLADGLTEQQRVSARPEVHLLPVSDHAAVTVDVDL